VVLVLLSYLVGHLVAALSSLLLEKALLDGLLKYPTARMFDDGAASGAKKLPWLRRVVKTVLAPGYCRPYSPQFIAAFKRRFKRIFGFDFVDYHDVFWLVWSYVSLHHAAAFQRATHFLNLYGFARNTSMALAVAAATPVWWRCWAHPIPVWLWILACAACAYLMFVNYAKLIRRLNDEIYRGFVALPPPNGRRGSRAGRPPRERTG